MKFAKYLTAFSVFSVVAGLTFPVQAITAGSNLEDITTSVNNGSINDLTEGALEDDTIVRFFEEKTNFQLRSDLTVDASPPDDIGSELGGGGGTQSTILSGEEVNSYYFHYDASSLEQTGSSTGKGNASSFTATFDQFNNEKIVGLILNGSSLSNSHPKVGRNSITYPSGRGIEGGDTISFKNSNTVEVQSLLTGSGIDNFRVITQGSSNPEAVPFETEGTMGLVALGGFLGYRYFKKRKQA